MEDCIRLADYASAIEMAFAANLLITAWAAFQERWKNEEATISKAVNDLEKDEYLEEELSFERIRKTINFWHIKGRQFFWRSALFAAVIFALVLYVLMWHLDLNTVRSGSGWRVLLMASAYTSPTLMLLMVLTWLTGNARANSQLQKLKEQAKKKREEGLEAFASLQRERERARERARVRQNQQRAFVERDRRPGRSPDER